MNNVLIIKEFTTMMLTLAILLSAVAILALGSILAWIRLGTGNIWPCITAHAAWNAIINGAFTPATQNTTENVWLGETGIWLPEHW